MKTVIRMAMLSLLLSAVPAFAQMDWSAVGSTGVIDETSTPLYEFNGPSLNLRPAQVGVAVARYQVNNTFGSGFTKMPPWTTMLMAYNDNGPGAFVRARLFRVNICTRVPELICEIRSQDNTNCDKCQIDPARPIDFNSYVYYIEADLTKNTPQDFPALHHLAIF
ncbi:MAG TPA: hypothetical protein VGF69_18330 [Thermoanaerobaculia bacterium]